MDAEDSNNGRRNHRSSLISPRIDQFQSGFKKDLIILGH